MKTQRLPRFNAGFILPALATALLLNTLLVAQAQPNPDKPDRPRPPVGERQRGEGPGSRFQPGPGGPNMERVLTEEQRQSMRDIMSAQREEMRGIQEKMRTARQELLKAALAETLDEDVVRAKALVVAKLEAEMTVLRVKAIAQVLPPLSEEQVEQILNPPMPNQMQRRDGEPGPGEGRGNRPPRGPRDGDGQSRPPKSDPQ